MEDLSLHILDVIENSLRAGASNVDIRMIENKNRATLTLEIEDDGKGMNESSLRRADDPFFTTKRGKKYGLGLALLAQAAEETGGTLKVVNGAKRGTKIVASFKLESIDLKPMGDIEGTLKLLRAAHRDVAFSINYRIENEAPA